MDRGFFEYRFSKHFNHLTYLGMWTTEIITSPLLRRLCLLLRFAQHSLAGFTVALQMANLYYVFGDFEKVTFNFCSSFLVNAVLLKLFWLYERRSHLNGLRFALWRDYLEIDNEEDLAVLDLAHHTLTLMYRYTYMFILSTISIVFIIHYISYSWGSTDLPFAAYIPLDYPKSLFVESICAFYLISVATEDELAGFSLILQLNAHYEILLNNVRRLDHLYGDEEDVDTSTKKKAKEIIKYCVRRHLAMIKYTKILDHIYSRCMVIQLFVGSFLVLMNGVELLVFVKEFNRKICCQMILIFVLINDLLLLCHFTSKLTSQCMDVGNAAYSTVWYRMDKATQRGLYMMMMGSSRPPRVTAGKIILVDLHTYMHLLKNILSWLMLIRQLVNKKK